MPENKGNLVTRRAFAERNGVKLRRVEVLADVTNKAMSTAYQMTEEVGRYGSGTPSPLHMLCELIGKLDEIEREENAEYSSALEMAEYPLSYLRQSRGQVPEGDASSKLNFLLKTVSDAIYQVGARELSDMKPGELKEFGQLMMSAATLATDLSMFADAQIEKAESGYPGAPVMRERLNGATAR